MIDLHEGKLCCSHCHHLIDMGNEASETCPYCKKKLTREEEECWIKAGTNIEIKQRKFTIDEMQAMYDSLAESFKERSELDYKKAYPWWEGV